jgi:benzoate membrane transport protein
VATIVGFGGTVALVVQAGQTLGASPGQIASMVTALCIGIGVPGMVLSWRLRIPVVLAWSTPGAALLAASSVVVGWPSAVGAFLFAGALMVLTGLVPMLGRLAARIPSGLASAMLAGVLAPFCFRLFQAVGQDAGLVLSLCAVFLVSRRLAPGLAMPLVLVAAFAFLFLKGQLGLPSGTPLFGALEGVVPTFDWRVLVSLGLPLYLVTLASQNLPGLMVLRADGYDPPAGRLIAATGAASVLAAPFGGHGVNLAAITAAICTGPEAHPDMARRWVVGVVYGGLYLMVALFAAPLAGLFMAMPGPAMAAIIGLALLAPLGGSLKAMMAEDGRREAAIVTFAATASGVSVLGVGSAFWGLVAGFLTLAALTWRRP